MESIRRIIFDLIIFAAFVFTCGYLYYTYGDDVRAFFADGAESIIFLDNLAVEVTIADTPLERTQGLSGISSIDELEGKLFIFDAEGYYGIWMKDMLFPIDIIYIDNDLTVVEIIENVSPDTFPRTFTSTQPARFVLETNAFFARTFDVEVGAKLSIPPANLPSDIRDDLQ